MSNAQPVPFNEPYIAGNEFAYMADAISRKHISGDGYYSGKCRELLERDVFGSPSPLTTSCSHALEIAALALGVGYGDEVIAPSFTFPTSIGAFVLRGAKPVFADIRPDTLNIDERQLESLITPKTRAIVVVHYAGVGCEMDAIMEIAHRHRIPVVEDNAHGLFGAYRDRTLGTFGAFSTLSFHETKNITCGEGGAIIVNDPAYIDQVEIIREKGTDRSLFLRGLVEKYTWVGNGSSYLPSDLLAAFLYAQLEMRSVIQDRRHAIWAGYHAAFAGWAERNGIQLPVVPEECSHSAFMYHLIMPSADERDRFIDHMGTHGVQCVFHYLPLHNSEMARSLNYNGPACPVTESVSSRLVRLPFFTGMDERSHLRVTEAVLAFESATRSPIA